MLSGAVAEAVVSLAEEGGALGGAAAAGAGAAGTPRGGGGRLGGKGTPFPVAPVEEDSAVGPGDMSSEVTGTTRKSEVASWRRAAQT